MNILEYKRGAIPSPPDVRDFIVAPAAIPKAFPTVYRKPYRPGIGKQGASSCAGWGAGYGFESVVGKKFSKGYPYSDREPEHYQGEGRIIREALDTMLKHGICLANDFTKDYEVPKAQQYFEANRTVYRTKAGLWRLKAYARAQNENAIKAALMQPNMFVEFCGPCPGFKTDKHGIYRMNKATYGYHAMAAIGWDEKKESAECPQSWGKSFGLDGFCYVPFEDIFRMNDAWVGEVELVGPAPSPTPQPGPDFIQRTLRKGMKGDDVKQLQGALIRLGYDLGKCGADGDYGTATYNAVRAYQYATGLVADGVAGLKTLGALYG